MLNNFLRLISLKNIENQSNNSKIKLSLISTLFKYERCINIYINENKTFDYRHSVAGSTL